MAVATSGVPTLAPSTADESSDDRFIRIAEVLDFVRGHRPPGKLTTSREPRSLDDCRVVRQGEIQPFCFRGAPAWANYEELREGFARARRAGGRSRNSPFSAAAVFAPVKVIVAERPNPIRAVLTYEPVYPLRGRMATLIPGQPLWLAYAAVAVLNSPVGHGLFDHIHQDLYPGQGLSTDGLSGTVLDRVPIARRGYARDELRFVASLAHQLSTVYEAEVDCATTFSTQVRDLRHHLLHAVPALLGLGDDQTRELLAAGGQLGATSGELDFRPSDFMSRLPSLPPIRLADDTVHARAAALGAKAELTDGERVEHQRLKRVLFWDEALAHGLPDELVVVSQAA